MIGLGVRMGRSDSARTALWLTRLMMVLIVALSGAVFAPTQPAVADACDGDITWTVNPYYDIVPGGVWSRASLAQNMGVFSYFGFNKNFAWYSESKTITVVRYDSREMATWHQMYFGTGRWIHDRYFTRLNNEYCAGATFRTWSWDGSFIAKVCGNHTPYARNPAPPKISGYKWNDLDGDGSWESGEPGKSGWKIELWKGSSRLATTYTDANGHYEFSIDARNGLTPGTYTVKEESRSGWIPTTVTSRNVTVYEGPYSAGRDYNGRNFGNFELGSIGGSKWGDTNLDGVWDSEESPVPGVEIVLTSNGSVVETVATGSDGSYLFTDLTAGDYSVAEILPDGWQQTWPDDSAPYECEVTSGKDFLGFDFGNAQLGGIQPLKVHDRDMDLERDENEELLAGWTMRLWDQSGVEFRDPLVTTDATTTSPAWERLPSGEYLVSEDQQQGYEPTGPTTKTVEVSPGQVVATTFMNVGYGEICGTKFHDLDGDGAFSDSTEGVGDWKISLYKDGALLTEAETDADGRYSFGSLLPGDYRVCEETRDNWVPVTSPCETVSVTPCSSTRVDFGNVEVGDIVGHKYEDLDGDGEYDPGEPPLPGVEITLTRSDGVAVGTPVVTNANGLYRFEDVLPGDHVVTESLIDGWEASAGLSRDVAVLGSSVSTVTPFLNVELAAISGAKFDDGNANGLWEVGSEAGLPGWEIELWTSREGMLSLEQTTVTGPEGGYRFEGLWPGDYQLREVSQDGWHQTCEPTELVSILSGNVVEGQDFGNIELCELDIYKWDDSNSNGEWDSTELPLEGWEFSLEGQCVDGSAVEMTACTGPDGLVCLDGLMPGQYTATEQAVPRSTEASGVVVEPGWRATTPMSATVELEEGSRETTSFGNIHMGWLWGRVTHEVYGHGVPGVPITLEEVDETVLTNENGYFFFYDVEPNETSVTPTPDYLVGMDLSETQYLTRDSVTKSAYVPEGGSDFVPFTIVDDGFGNKPRTIGYWKNWDKHFSEGEIASFLELVNAGSEEFHGLSPADVYQILQVNRKTGPEGKTRAQFLAFWLNVASGNLALLTSVDVTRVDGWEQVVSSADESGTTTIIDFMGDMEAAFLGGLDETWEIVKDLLDFMNNGRLT